MKSRRTTNVRGHSRKTKKGRIVSVKPHMRSYIVTLPITSKVEVVVRSATSKQDALKKIQRARRMRVGESSKEVKISDFDVTSFGIDKARASPTLVPISSSKWKNIPTKKIRLVR